MMQPRLSGFIIAVSILLIFVLLELIRRGKLREEYSLVWLFGALTILLMVIFRGTLRALADFLQVEYAPSFIFMVGIAVLVLIQLAHTATVSFLTSRNRDLAQKYAILELGMRQLYGQIQELETHDKRLGFDTVQIVTDRLRNCLNVSDFMQCTLELAVELVGANSGSLLFFDERGRLIENLMRFEGRSFREQLQALDDTVEKGVSGWVYTNRKPLLVESTLDDPLWLKRPWEREAMVERSALCVPLAVNGQVAGVLTLSSPPGRRFTDQDLMKLVAVAALVAHSGGPVLAGLKERDVQLVQTSKDALEEQTV